MAINIDAAAMEARYAKQGAVVQSPQGEPPPLFGPGTSAAQIPVGQPIPEGVIIQQVVGRGQPAQISVVPPQVPGGPPPPQIAVVPPSGAARTSIGTYIEVSPTTTNPLTTGPAPIPSGTVAPPIEPPKEPPKKRKLDLTQLLLDHIFELGGEDGEQAQKFYDRSNQTLKSWCRNPAIIPLQAVLKFISRKPGVAVEIQEELEPHFAIHDGGLGVQSLPNRGKMDVVICSAVLDRPTLPFMWTLLYLVKKYELGIDVASDSMVVRSRNLLAHRFLQSGATWSLWLDSDIAAPIGNPTWYKWITGSTAIPEEYVAYDVLQRLLSHGKPAVGAVYASRRYYGPLVIQPEINPRHDQDKQLCAELRRGTARGIHAVDWIGFGCALIHREVFLEVQRRFPNQAPETEAGPWRFFDTHGLVGEDEAFCERVRACNIPIWLDAQLICAHVGRMAFMPEMTRSALSF